MSFDFGVFTKTDYVGNFIYENGVLKRILHDNGVINVLSNNNYEYQFFIKDHLGNTRVVCQPDFETGGTLKSSPVVVRRSNYYPFGMLHGGREAQPLAENENRYLYNGKEYQARKWDNYGYTFYSSLHWYDYGARFYDAQLGRWHSVDPASELYYSWSPYHYVRNNPIRLTDPNGMYDDGFVIDEEGNISPVVDKNGNVDKTGGDSYDVLWTKKDYENGERSYDYKGTANTGIRIDDKEFIPELRKSKPEAVQKDVFDGSSHQGYYAEINKNQALNVFTFLADAVAIEWSLIGTTNNKFAIGRLTNSQAFDFSELDQYSDLSKHAIDIHSHPNATYDDFRISGKDKRAAETIRKYNSSAKFYVYMPMLTKDNYNEVMRNRYINTPKGLKPYPLMKQEPATKFFKY